MKALCAIAACFLVLTTAAAAPPPPTDLHQRAGFDQRLGARVPMSLVFRDADGRRVRLGDLADGKPMLLAMGYYHCPNLCDVMLDGMAQSVAGMSLVPGRDFQTVFVGIDPRETPSTAADKRSQLAAHHAGAHVGAWHMLTGAKADVKALADAIGYRYFYDRRNDQYAHAAGVVVLGAGGTVTQYLFGVRYPPRSVRLALVAASAGKVGNVVDQLVLLCCGYDPSTGRYSLLIGRVMQVACALTVLVLGGLVARLLRRRGRDAKR